MKNRFSAGSLLVCLLLPLSLWAQEPFPVKQHIPDKPLLFSQLPEQSICSFTAWEQMLQWSVGNTVELLLTEKAFFKGMVTEKIHRSSTTLSLNIKLSNYPETLFNITLISLPNQDLKVTGRIVNPNSGDVLLLLNENNKYVLKKQQQKFFMTE